MERYVLDGKITRDKNNTFPARFHTIQQAPESPAEGMRESSKKKKLGKKRSREGETVPRGRRAGGAAATARTRRETPRPGVRCCPSQAHPAFPAALGTYQSLSI